MRSFEAFPSKDKTKSLNILPEHTKLQN